MLKMNHNLLIWLVFVPVMATGFQAQEPQRQGSATAAASQPARASVTAAPTGGEFSAAVQTALEAGDTRAALRLCGAPCRTGGAPGSITTAQPGGTRDYQCQNGNCACTSISDCVAMTKECEEGTQGCNDYGCTCKQKEGED